MKDKFKKEWFNPLFYYINHYLKNNDIREIYVYGGSSSAKTHSILQALLLDGYYRDYSSIVYRKEQTAIKTTVKNECKAIIENLNLSQVKEYDFEFRYNEKKLQFKGIDKEGKIKGLKGYRKLFFDEVDQFKVEEFNQAKLRLRGEDNQQLLFSWNPVDERHWLKKYLDNFEWISEPPLFTENHKLLHENSFIKRCGNKILIQTTVLDNYWVVGGDWGRYDEHVINEFETLKLTNTDLYNVYALGNWGTLRNDNPFFYAYKKDIHYSYSSYQPTNEYFLDISFDFNITPCTGLIGQHNRSTKTFNIFDLILTDINTMAGNSSLKSLCLKIKQKYIDTGLFVPYRIRVTGDASGRNGSADKEINNTFYNTIREILKIPEQNFYVRKSNLQHITSGEVCNAVLVNIPKNHFTIFDIPELDTDINSAYFDDKQTLDEAKKKHGLHIVDAFRYLIDFWFGMQNNRFMKDFYDIKTNITNIKKRIENE